MHIYNVYINDIHDMNMFTYIYTWSYSLANLNANCSALKISPPCRLCFTPSTWPKPVVTSPSGPKSEVMKKEQCIHGALWYKYIYIAIYLYVSSLRKNTPMLPKILLTLPHILRVLDNYFLYFLFLGNCLGIFWVQAGDVYLNNTIYI